MTAGSSIGGQPTTPLLDAWDRFRGAIDCGASGHGWSADRLRAESDVLKTHLRAAGPGPNDRVGIALPNGAEFPVALMATLQMDCHPVLISATARPAEVATIVDRYGVRGIIRRGTAGVDLTKGSTQSLSTDSMNLQYDERPKGSALSVSETLDTTILHGTSGTYGTASFCLRNQQVAVAEAATFIDAIGCYDAARVVVTTPLSHAYAFGFGLVACLLTHSTLVLDSAFNPRTLMARQAERPNQILAIVPPMARVLAALGSHGVHPPMAPHVFFAGAPCPAETAQCFHTVFGVPMHAIYGTTETGGVTTTYGTPLTPGTVGYPMGGVDVSIRNQDAYDSLGPDIGEVFVHSTSMMQGYADADTRWAPDGAFGTGDLGCMDDEGRLHLVGRVKDMINLGGMKVDPSTVEQALVAHPSVIEAAVYPGSHADGSEFVQAAIVPAPGCTVDPEVLKAHCFAVLDAFRVPTVFHSVAQLPRTPSGKCVKIKCPGFPDALRV